MNLSCLCLARLRAISKNFKNFQVQTASSQTFKHSSHHSKVLFNLNWRKIIKVSSRCNLRRKKCIWSFFEEDLKSCVYWVVTRTVLNMEYQRCTDNYFLIFLKLGLSKTKLFYCKAKACYILFLFLRVCPNRNKVFLYLLIPCFELVQHFLVRPIVPFYHSFIIPKLTKKVGMLMSQFRIPHAKWPLDMKKSNFWANY